MATREELSYTLDTNASTLGKTSTDNLTIERYADAMFTLLDEDEYKKAETKITAKIEEMITLSNTIFDWRSERNELEYKWETIHHIINSTVSRIKKIFTEENWELETQQALIDNIYAVRFYTIALEQLKNNENENYSVKEYEEKIKISNSNDIFTKKGDIILPKKGEYTFENRIRIGGLCEIGDRIKLIVDDNKDTYFILEKMKDGEYKLIKATNQIKSRVKFDTQKYENQKKLLHDFLIKSGINFTSLEQYRPIQKQKQNTNKTIINNTNNNDAISPLYKSQTFYFNPNDITTINNTSWIFANNLNEFNSETNKQTFEINPIKQSFQFTTNNKKENLQSLLDNREEREKQWRIEIQNKESFEKTIKENPSKIKWFLQTAGQLKIINNNNKQSFEIKTPIKINYYANEALAMY